MSEQSNSRLDWAKALELAAREDGEAHRAGMAEAAVRRAQAMAELVELLGTVEAVAEELQLSDRAIRKVLERLPGYVARARGRPTGSKDRQPRKRRADHDDI